MGAKTKPQLTHIGMKKKKLTCESFDAGTFEQTCRTVLIIPLCFGCNVPAVVDVIVLLLDLDTVEISR